MMDEDRNVWLFCLAESPTHESESEKLPPQDDSGDNQVWACYDNGTLSDKELSDQEHSPGSYDGSQYTSESEPEEKTGFLFDKSYDADSEFEEYMHTEIPKQFAGAWDGSGSDSEYESCLSEPCNNSESDGTHLRLDFGEYFWSIETKENGGRVASAEPTPTQSTSTKPCQKRMTAEKHCLAAWVEFNGMKAFTLFDSGNTADTISPDFTRAAKLKIY
ncbi:hypothetical protein L218DRAFT_998715 [Marasmius fiardii PR-910]|nr:hypothetical protein L218DRAFT_998715 [Marasmius fiardii PR-910]